MNDLYFYTLFQLYQSMKVVLGLVAFMTLLYSTVSQILAIDFGTEFIKSAVVNSGTGKSFSIVNNHKSERKFLNSIGFYSQERFYEAESLPKRPRLPTNCFIFTKLLADSFIDSGIPSRIKKDLLLSYIKEDEENQLMAKFILQKFPEDANEVTLIEVVAMILKYAKANAETQIKSPIKDTILTVPSYWNVRMRQFLIQAAEVADLYVLSLIAENTGAAINYALNQRTKNTTEKILFYNLGSNSLQMTIAEFKQVAQQKGKPVESIFILGDYGKPYVGGLRFDVQVYNYFLKKFQKKYGKELSSRGKIKLFIEANKVKEVLSANKQATLFVQGLMDSIDYMQKITRAEFQQMSMQIFEEITSPIKRFLFDHDLKFQDLDGVQLIGGSIRIPKIQDMISEIIQDKEKMGTHINGDEAMVLGAAFYGANSSKKFKVKGIHLYDGFNFEIRAVIRNLDESIEEESEGYIFKNVTIFKQKTRFGITKQINFKAKKNLILELYKEDQQGIELLRKTKFQSIEKVNETDFKVSLTLSLDPIQIVTIKSSQITYKKDEIQTYLEKVKKPSKKEEKSESEDEDEEKNESTDDKKENEQEKEEQSKEEVKEETKEEVVEQEKDKQEKQEKQEKSEDKEEQKQQGKEKDEQKKEQKIEKEKKKKKRKPKQEYETVQRNKTVTKKYERQINREELYNFWKGDKENKQLSKKMLKEYENRQQMRQRLAESKNKLQALIYEGRQKMQHEEFLQFTQEKQKIKIQELVKEKSQWLDETMSSDAKQYDDHFKTLNRPLQKIKKRMYEFNHRQLEKKKSLKAIEEYQNLTKKIREKKDWITQEQVEELSLKIDESVKEIENMYEKMLSAQKNENPTYLIKDFQRVIDRSKDEYFKLMSTQKPKKETKKEEKKEEQSFSDEL